MKFEIINPSDKAYLDAEEYDVACLASLLVTEQHGLKQVDGEFKMPPFLFGGADKWFTDNFKISVGEDWKKKRKEVIACLKTVRYSDGRSSLRNFVKYAHDLAKSLEKTKVKKVENDEI